MGPLRRAEQRAAAAAVGVTDVRFLGPPDGRLEPTLDLRRDIARAIRQWMRHVAGTHGLSDGRLAEAFHVVRTA